MEFHGVILHGCCSLGLSPDSNFDKAVADMVVDSVMDIRAKRTKYHFESDAALKGPLQYLFRPLLGKNEFAVTQHMYAFIGPNLDNIH